MPELPGSEGWFCLDRRDGSAGVCDSGAQALLLLCEGFGRFAVPRTPCRSPKSPVFALIGARLSGAIDLSVLYRIDATCSRGPFYRLALEPLVLPFVNADLLARMCLRTLQQFIVMRLSRTLSLGLLTEGSSQGPAL